LFAFRVVILWVLIILAPLAFFMGGAKGVVGQAEGYYSDWWKRFSSAVALGPILTFFLWLSLAAAGSAGLAETQGFDLPPADNPELSTFGFITQTFDTPNMISLVIALALLFAGFEISQQTASGIGGKAGQMAAGGVAGITGLARKMAYGGAALTAGGALAAGAFAYRRTPAKRAVQWAKGGIGGAVQAGGQYLEGTWARRIPIVGGAFRGITNIGAGLQRGVAEQKREVMTEARKSIGDYSFDETLALANRPETAGMSEVERAKGRAARHSMLFSKIKRAKLSAGDKKKFAADVYNSWDELDEPTQDKWKDVLRTDPQLVAENPWKKTETEKDEALCEQMAMVYKNPSNLSELSPESFEEPRVQNYLRNERIPRLSVKTTGEEYLVEGRGGQLAKNRWEAMYKKEQTDFDQSWRNWRNEVIQTTSSSAPAGAPSTDAENDLNTRILNLTAGSVTIGGAITSEMLDSDAMIDKLTVDPRVRNSVLPAIGAKPELREKMSNRISEREDKTITEMKREGNPQKQKPMKDRLTAYQSARLRIGLPPAGYDPAKQKFDQSDPYYKVKTDRFKERVGQAPETLGEYGDVVQRENLSDKNLATSLSMAIKEAFIRSRDSGDPNKFTLLESLKTQLRGADPRTLEFDQVVLAFNTLDRTMKKLVSAYGGVQERSRKGGSLPDPIKERFATDQLNQIQTTIQPQIEAMRVTFGIEEEPKRQARRPRPIDDDIFP
jgi:hypothetical protein